MTNRIPTALMGATIALSFLWISPVEAALRKFDAIYTFGDSLSDTGNVYTVSGQTFPPEPFYTNGRFSNGNNWVDYLGQKIGINPVNYTSLSPSNSIPSSGVNFAFGAAKTDGALAGAPFSGVKQQVDAYESLLNGQSADPNALYIVWVGANDYLDGATNPQSVVDNLSASIEDLINTGARNIMIGNLPLLGEIPAASSQGEQVSGALNALTIAHNTFWDRELDRLSSLFPQSNLISLNTFELIANIQANPEAFGLSDGTNNCTSIDFPNVSAADVPGWQNCLSNNPDEYFFWDNQHPTTAGHQLIANFAAQSLQVPEPSMISALGLLGLGLAGIAFKKSSTKQ